jgi:hypothetical protein
VAVRARSRTPAVVPTYMSRVVRTLACPAMQDTSVASSLQVNRAVTQNTCRRLCQVQVPLPPVSRHPAARWAPAGHGGRSWRTASTGRAGSGRSAWPGWCRLASRRVRPGSGPRSSPPAGTPAGCGRVDGLAVLAALGRPGGSEWTYETGASHGFGGVCRRRVDGGAGVGVARAVSGQSAHQP